MDKSVPVRCCRCIPLGLGVKLIGLLDCARLLLGIYQLDMLAVWLYLSTSMVFVWMTMRDSFKTRQAFFVTYMLYHLVQLSVDLIRHFSGETMENFAEGAVVSCEMMTD